MDFKQPIDITAVLTAVKKHKDILKAVDKLDASEVLKHFTPVPGITDSLELGKVEGGSISSKYTGKFTAGKYLGKIVPRRLVVRPVVMEMSDEPERYRRTYIAQVPGTLRKEHPFELWLINHGHELASNDLLFAIFTAKYSADEAKTDIQDSFDGVGTIVSEGEAVGDISSTEGNVYATGELTRADIGEKLLEMWRHVRAPSSARRISRCSFPTTWAICTTIGVKMKAPSLSDSRRTLPTRSISLAPTTDASWFVCRTFLTAASS